MLQEIDEFLRSDGNEINIFIKDGHLMIDVVEERWAPLQGKLTRFRFHATGKMAADKKLPIQQVTEKIKRAIGYAKIAADMGVKEYQAIPPTIKN